MRAARTCRRPRARGLQSRDAAWPEISAVATSHTIIIAGGGIGGLTAALALVRQGYRVVVLEAAREFAEIGAGIQLSPNAIKILRSLGIAEQLRGYAVAPEGIIVRDGRNAREIVRIPLGATAEQRYGAPYWVVHRADLQRVLLTTLEGHSEISLRLGMTVRDFTAAGSDVVVGGKTDTGVLVEERGAALIGADGLWSAVRMRLHPASTPRFRRRVAWRATVDAAQLGPRFRDPATSLWLGRAAHLVHYPVRGRAQVNLVAVVNSAEAIPGWDRAGAPAALAAHFSAWAPQVRDILAAAEAWQTWSLHDLPPLPAWGRGPVTLLGDAAHAMLPFLAQGGAMAIEDAFVLAQCIAAADATPTALRRYELERVARTRDAARLAIRNGHIYGLTGAAASARNIVMRLRGGNGLLASQDWLYGWNSG
jgi:salicylate hydroxylase